MKINVEKMAHLSRIRLREDEKAKVGEDLAKILSYIDKLAQLDTENVPPTTHVLSLKNVFRKDVPVDALVIQDVLKHAPSYEANFFKVPKIIEGND